MTLDEKWTALEEYCNGRSCAECKLEKEPCSIGENCPTELAKNIERCYGIVFCVGTETTNNEAKPVGSDGAAIVVPPALAKLSEPADICTELNRLYARKNADYGDSFHKTYVEEGMAMARIRLSDKLERFKKLTRSNEQNVHDESVRDTLIDLANYAILTVMELDGGVSDER